MLSVRNIAVVDIYNSVNAFDAAVLSAKLLLFDAMGPTFRTVKLRGQNPKCAVCGTEPTITALIDYEQFCSSTATDKVVMKKILDDQLCISVQVLVCWSGLLCINN